LLVLGELDHEVGGALRRRERVGRRRGTRRIVERCPRGGGQLGWMEQWPGRCVVERRQRQQAAAFEGTEPDRGTSGRGIG
jgi:hypothetical protein